MAFNFDNPPPYLTPHRVTASARMARVYGYLNSEGIKLTPFSTDQCVAAAMPRLLVARDKLQAGTYQAKVLEDLASIMGRVPAARSHGEAAKVTEANTDVLAVTGRAETEHAVDASEAHDMPIATPTAGSFSFLEVD